MILCLDTSSLVKLYIDEPHAEMVRKWVKDAEVIATSRVAYPEAMSALTRRRRTGDIAEAGFKQVRSALTKQWSKFAVLDLDEIKAGNLAVKHGLRGFDAIHLEAALATSAQAGDVLVGFSSFDANRTPRLQEKASRFSVQKNCENLGKF